MLEKLKFVQEISSLFRSADVHLMPNTEDALSTYMSQALSPRFGVNLSNHPAISQLCALDSNHVYEFLPFPGITALLYSCKTINQILFVGPVRTESYSASNFTAYLQQQGISQQIIKQLTETASELPNVPTYTLYRLMDVLLKHLCEIHYPIPIKKADSDPNFTPFVMLHNNEQFQDIRKIRQIEHRYASSSALTEAVKLGNLSLALQIMGNPNGQQTMSVRSPSPLRNMQNYCIVLNTQLRHSLEGSGIHPYELDRLSNEIGMQIERLTAPDVALHFNMYIIEQYCRLVQEQSYRQLSPLTHQTVIYIKNHLHANLTVKETAKVLGVNANYLSTQFHENLGLTFIDFIHRERTNQAAALLKHTNLQIQQVASAVGYNNTSYFAKQFQRYQGMNPSHYRQEGII